jgi:uncharacterized protein
MIVKLDLDGADPIAALTTSILGAYEEGIAALAQEVDNVEHQMVLYRRFSRDALLSGNAPEDSPLLAALGRLRAAEQEVARLRAAAEALQIAIPQDLCGEVLDKRGGPYVD